MSNWVTKCEDALKTLGFPYDFERFTADTDCLPDTFLVYFLVDNPGRAWGDGLERAREPRVQVSLFYREPSTALTVPERVENAMASVGFLRVGAGRIPYQTDTGHYGWRCDFRFYERRETE